MTVIAFRRHERNPVTRKQTPADVVLAKSRSNGLSLRHHTSLTAALFCRACFEGDRSSYIHESTE
jgi:hypothetical protein